MNGSTNKALSLVTILFLLLATLNSAAQRPTPPTQAPPEQRQLGQAANNRVALVIGNNAYQTAPLRNPINDARAIAGVLRELGFEVDLVADVDFRTMEETISRFIRKLESGSVGLFYYAGHGIQIEGENYLIPIDFVARDEADAKYASYSASRLTDRMESARTKLNIIILDACRNNPFQTSRSGSRGLAVMTSGRGTFIAFATSAGKTASDNPGEANGLFTKYLIEVLRQPGLKLSDVFDKVRAKVARASNSEQVPFTGSNVIGDFYFNASRPSRPAQSGADPGDIADTKPPATETGDIGDTGPSGVSRRKPERPRPARSNDIFNFRAVDVSNTEMQVTVDYTYTGDPAGEVVYLAVCARLSDGRQVPGTNCHLMPIAIGSRSLTVSIKRYRLLGSNDETYAGSSVDVCLCAGPTRRTGQKFLCKSFQFHKTWRGGLEPRKLTGKP